MRGSIFKVKKTWHAFKFCECGDKFTPTGKGCKYCPKCIKKRKIAGEKKRLKILYKRFNIHEKRNS